MTYIIAPTSQVIGDNGQSPYLNVIGAVEAAVIQRASEIWDGWESGGLTPGPNQYGIAPLRMNDMAVDTTAAAASSSYSFDKAASSVGWADLYNFNVRDDMILGLAGISIDDPTLRVWQTRIEVGDKRLPVIDLQTAHSFDRSSFILKQDVGKELIAGPRDRFVIRGYWGTTGTNRVTPLGIMAYRNLSDMLTEL